MPKHDSAYKEKMVKVSLFRKNSLPYAMILFSILFELAYTVIILDDIAVSYMMGAITVVNIFLLFMLFACAVKVGTYRKWWVKATLVIGIYALIRGLVIVPAVLHPQTRFGTLLFCNIVMALLCITASLRSLALISRRDRFLQTEEADYLLAKDLVR